MCGIVGFINIDTDQKLEVMKKLELRGRDGFGFLTWNETQQNIQKTLLTPTQYLEEKGDQLKHILDCKVVIANTRAIPTTEFQSGAGSDLQNQQPFSKRRYALVFNGLIANDKELIEKFNLSPDAPVDTAMLCPLFEKVGVIEGMKMLDGSFALIVLDKVEKKLYFGKNFMPLCYFRKCYGDGPDQLIVTSLKEMMPDWYITNDNSIQEVSPYTCMEYDLQTGWVKEHLLYRKTRNKKALIICSSGTDSVTTAYVYKYLGYEVTLAHFTYGQAAETVEKFAVEKIANSLGAKLIVYDAKPLFSAFKESSKLLHQTEADPNQQMLDAESTLSYVPNRNAIFSMIIGALAEQEGCDTVAFGGQQMDSVIGSTPFIIRDANGNLIYKTIAELEQLPFGKWFVQSFNRNTYKVEEHEITKVWKHKVNRRMFELETKLGDKIKVTEDHSLFVIDQTSGEIYCKDGKDVTTDDYLVMTKNTAFNIRPIMSKTVDVLYKGKRVQVTIPLTQTVLEFLGLWLAEGCYPSSYEICTSIAKKEFNKEWWNQLKVDLNFTTYRLREFFGTAYDVLIGDAKLQRAMKALGFVGKSHVKQIPDWVFNLSREQISFILKGYFSGDGCISYQGEGRKSLVIDASSTSQKLIIGMKHLLMTLGIVSSIRKRNPTPFIQKEKTYLGRESWELCIRGVQFITKFRKYVRFLYQEKQTKLNDVLNYRTQDHFAKVPVAKGILKYAQAHSGTFSQMPYLTNMYTQKGISRDGLLQIASVAQNLTWEHLAESDVHFVPIKSITEIPCEDFVYDFSVAKNENFFDANGILYHNSVYPDNTPDFVLSVDKLLKYSLNWQTNVKFSAPLIHLIKHEIVKLGLALEVPFDYVCSCYYPKLVDNKIVVCGKCGCCQFRFSSFKMLGVKDTQQYETLPDPNWFDGLADKISWSSEDVKIFIRNYVEKFA